MQTDAPTRDDKTNAILPDLTPAIDVNIYKIELDDSLVYCGDEIERDNRTSGALLPNASNVRPDTLGDKCNAADRTFNEGNCRSACQIFFVKAATT
jgi:hypothetical protein